MNLLLCAKEKVLSMNNSFNQHVAIVCNGKSGKGKPLKLLPLLESYLIQHNISFQSFITSIPKNLNGFTDLVIMGGDGTINYTLNYIRDITIPIGIIRCGTGNDFTEMIFGKQSMQEQFNTAVFGTPKPVDAGVCNQQLFINGVGIGFDGWVVKKLLAKKLFTGKAAYYSTVISLLLFYKEQLVTLSSNNKSYSFPLFMLSAANGKTYGGGFKVAPKASLTDGLLDLIVVKKISLFNRLKYLPIIENGKHLDTHLPFIEYEQTTSLTIQSVQPLLAHLDGELMVANSFEIKILPNKFLIRQ